MWMLLAWLAGAAPAPLSQLSRVSVGGREHVRLQDWARLQGFRGHWLNSRDFRLTNSSARLEFTVNSQRMIVNGISVFLTAPVLLQSAAPLIALADLQTTVHPLLWPTRRQGVKTPLICIDAGHGGRDTGNLEGKRLEKDLTLSLARELAAQLRKAGYKAFLTRSWDTSLELDTRPEIARKRGAHLFVSLHFNAAGNREASGAEVYCLTPPYAASTNARGEGAGTGPLPGNRQNDANLLLAYHLQRSMVSRLKMEDRGVRRARWAVLRQATMPAVLVEAGFMSNPDDSKKLYSSAWRKQLAGSLVEGIKSYQRLIAPAT